MDVLKTNLIWQSFNSTLFPFMDFFDKGKEKEGWGKMTELLLVIDL